MTVGAGSLQANAGKTREELTARKQACVEMAKSGMTFQEIADYFGLSRDTVRQTCAKYGIRENRPHVKRKQALKLFNAGKTDEEVSEIIGWSVSTCSNYRSTHGIRKIKAHPCAVCGKSTDRPKYCSEACSRAVSAPKEKAKRRARIDSALVDYDISLPKLFRRDKGVCWICGMMCSYKDVSIKDGQKIAGNLYPSIDHVQPLSRGGEHSWSNVRLAHRLCNLKKNAKEFCAD